MSETAICSKIKEIIARVAGLDAARIPDGATLRGDLNLDSLSLLEIAVDVDFSFQLRLPDESYREIACLSDMVALVQRRLSELAPQREMVEG